VNSEWQMAFEKPICHCSFSIIHFPFLANSFLSGDMKWKMRNGK